MDGNLYQQQTDKNQLLEQIIEGAQEGIIVYDRDLSCRVWNPFMEQLTGVLKEDILGHHPAEISSFFQGIDLIGRLGKILENGHTSTIEFPYPLPGEKEQGWAADTSSPLRDSAGNITGIVAIIHDITNSKQAEETLREEMEFSRSLVDTAQTIILVLDVKGRILRFNPYMEEISGYQLAEVKGKDWFSLFLPAEDHSNIRALFQEAVGDIQVRGNVNPIVTKDGRQRQIEWYSKTLKDASGKVVGLLNVGQDITERKVMEHRVFSLAQIVENSLHEVYIFDRESLRFLFFNRGARKNLGYGIDELRTLTPLDIKPEHTHTSFMGLIRPLLNNEAEIIKFVTQHKRKDGSLYPAEVHLQLSTYEGNQVFVAIVLNISERLSADEKLLKVSRQRKELEFILNKSPAVVFLWRAAEGWPVAYVSENVAQWGYSAEDFIAGKVSYLDLIHPEDMEWVRAEVAGYSEGGVTEFRQEYRLITKSGDILWTDNVTWIRRDGNGKITHYQGIVVDITERKNAEKELRHHKENLEEIVQQRTAELDKTQLELLNLVDDLNRANVRLKELDQLKSMFIASMSHELRTPLNSIIGFSSILLNEWVGSLNDEQKENLSAILRSGKHLLALVNDVIDISKVEAGMVEVSRDEFNLAELLAEVGQTFAKEVRDRQLSLNVETLQLPMYTDRRRLLQCLLNLVGNAIKFTEQGEVSVAVGYDEGEGAVTFAVTDTGVGIGADDQAKLFQAFSRVQSPISAKVLGSGLGLYLTKKIIVEILHGTIRVTSEPGSGSTFSISIPCQLEEELTQQQESVTIEVKS